MWNDMGWSVSEVWNVWHFHRRQTVYRCAPKIIKNIRTAAWKWKYSITTQYSSCTTMHSSISVPLVCFFSLCSYTLWTQRRGGEYRSTFNHLCMSGLGTRLVFLIVHRSERLEVYCEQKLMNINGISLGRIYSVINALLCYWNATNCQRAHNMKVICSFGQGTKTSRTQCNYTHRCNIRMQGGIGV